MSDKPEANVSTFLYRNRCSNSRFNGASKQFPAIEKFGLTNQIRRAAVSIVLNIAEGSTKGSDIDFRRYLKIAQGSVNEVVAGFYIALDQKFIDEKHFEQIYDFSLKINSKLNAFIKALVAKHSALSN